MLWAVKIAAWVLFVHACDGRGAQAFGLETESAARQTVAPRAKGGAGDKDIRLQVSQVALDQLDNGLLVLTKIAIPAHDGGDHLTFIGEDLLKEPPRPQCTVLQADRSVRFLLASKTPEKCVDVMHDA